MLEHRGILFANNVWGLQGGKIQDDAEACSWWDFSLECKYTLTVDWCVVLTDIAA